MLPVTLRPLPPKAGCSVALLVIPPSITPRASTSPLTKFSSEVEVTVPPAEQESSGVLGVTARDRRACRTATSTVPVEITSPLNSRAPSRARMVPLFVNEPPPFPLRRRMPPSRACIVPRLIRPLSGLGSRLKMSPETLAEMMPPAWLMIPISLLPKLPELLSRRRSLCRTLVKTPLPRIRSASTRESVPDAGEGDVPVQDEIGKAAGRLEHDVGVVRDRAGERRDARSVELDCAQAEELRSIGDGEVTPKLENRAARGRGDAGKCRRHR